MNNENQTAKEMLDEALRLKGETIDLLEEIKCQSAENLELLNRSEALVRHALGEVKPTVRIGTLAEQAEELAADSEQLAETVRNRNCQDVVLQIMQLAMMNKGIINIHAEYSPSNDNFQVYVVAFGSSYKADEVEWLYESRVYFSFDENPLQKMLEIEDKLLEMIADAKDKAEVAA